MDRLPALRTRCLACGAALTRHEQFAGEHCSDWQCRHRRLEAAREAELKVQLHAARDAAAAAVDDPSAALAPVVRVSWYETPLEPVPPSRRLALQAHLMGLQPEVEAMAAAPPEDDTDPWLPQAPQPEVDALLGQVCARCTGYCCRHGHGRYAFLDAAAMLKAHTLRPDLAYADLVEGYLAEIPALHHAESCAFHGELGCVLPRDRRADICNSFECPGLKQTRMHAEKAGLRRVFVVRLDKDHPPVGAFAPPI